MKKITSFKIFENNNFYTDAPEYSLDELKKIFNQLIKDGDITLSNDNKSVDDLLPKFINKTYKYPRVGFESLMFNLSDDSSEDFISEGDKDHMEEYINRIKEFGIDVTELEELQILYKQYRETENELEDIEHLVYNYDEDDSHDDYEIEEHKENVATHDKLIEKSNNIYSAMEKTHKIIKQLSTQIVANL